MPGIPRGETHHRGRRSPSRTPAPTSPASRTHARAATASTGCSTAASCSSPMACTPTSYFVAARTGSAPRTRSRSSRSRRARRGSRVGRALDKTGWLSSDTAELVFDDCRVPAEHLLGEEDARLLRGDEELPDRAHRARRDGGRPLRARALELTLEHVQRPPGLRRAAVGQAGDPPAAGDARRRRSRAARQFLYHCAWRVDAGARRACRTCRC